MAHFKLYLLTPAAKNSADGSFRFLKTIISEFYHQKPNNNSTLVQNNSFCYSLNEKLSIHKNGQKEFSFSMIKNQWLGDELIINPFIKQIHNGTQLLLIDKYGNEMFFTVKNISYKFGNKNITYDYACQDSFTYQTIRQNDGYTIDNSFDSSDFIGAKSIDWWVLNKIKPECHLNYQYIPLFQGLFLDNNNNIQTYTEKSQLRNVQKIIKPAYSQSEYPDYYETIPFSVSGSNCSAALLSLGGELGLMLNYKEHEIKHDNVDTHVFLRYFWYEPEKNEAVSNLKYSPYSSIQSLGLTQAADSLTTVLNVDANNINDEIVTLLPEAPLFFKKLFISSSWKNSTFEDGFFTKICQGEVFRSENSVGDFSYSSAIGDGAEKKTIDGVNYLYIKINNQSNGFQIPFYYPKVSFIFEDKESYCYINDKRYTPRTNSWAFVVVDAESETKSTRNQTTVERIYNDTFNPIPFNKLGGVFDAYVRIRLDDDIEDPITIQTSLFILNFTRDVSAEELEFAKIADECPWLENRLIDFSYFYQQGIINDAEYHELLNIIQNELRIINGQLLSYSSEYYNAIHTKTSILSKINETIDSLGATFNADVVDYYSTNGVVKDYKYFTNAYNAMIDAYFAGPYANNELLNYDELLTEYFNKYFKAQQRFLKNIYNFKEYFNSPVELDNNVVYRHNIKLTGIEERKKEIVTNKETCTYSYLSFNATAYALVDLNFNLYYKDSLKPTADIYSNDKKTLVNVVHKDNCCQRYYIASLPKGSLVPAAEYNPNKTYYRVLYKAKKGKEVSNNIQLVLNGKTIQCTLHHSDDNFVYYGFRQSDYKTIKEAFEEFTYDVFPMYDSSNKYTRTLETVSFKEIIAEYLLRKYEEGQTSQWFYHDLDTYLPTTKWKTRHDDLDDSMWSWGSQLSPIVWLGALGAEDENKSEWDEIYNAIDSSDEFSTGYQNAVLKLYFERFPITSVTYVGSKYKKTSFSWVVNDKFYSPQYERVNNKGQTVSEYIKWWERTQNGEILDEIKNPTSYTEKQTIPLITPLNESSYYKRVVANPFWGYLAGTVGGVLTSAIGGLVGVAAGISIGSLIANYVWLLSDTTWATSGKNTRIANDTPMKYIYSGYCDNRQVSGLKSTDSRLNYMVGQDSYQTFLDLFQNRRENDFIYTINEIKTSKITSEMRNPPITVNGDNVSYTNETLLTSVGEKALVSSNLSSKNKKDYFDYYSLFGFTYHDITREHNTNIKYRESFLRPLTLESYVNPKFKYKLLVQNNGTKNHLIFKDQSTFSLENHLDITDDYKPRLNKSVYYPIANSVIDIDFSVLNWKEGQESMTLDDALAQGGYAVKDSDGFWVYVDDKQFMVFQEEDFKRTKVILSEYFDLENYLKKEYRFSLYDGRTIESPEQATEVNFYTQKDLLYGFFEALDQDEDHQLIEKVEDVVWEDYTNEKGELVEATKIYEKQNDEYVRIYSILQLRKQHNCYYLHNHFYSLENFESKPQTMGCPVYIHTEQYESGELVSSVVKQLDTLVDFGYVQTNNIVNKELEYFSDRIPYSYEITSEVSAVIENMTNGDFWYTYSSRMDLPTLYQRAILIASDLTIYWSQAYSASKYCEFFLPETWQLNQNGKTNFFVNNIFTPVLKEIDEDNETAKYTLKLLDVFLPEVKVYSNGKTTRLPQYEVTRSSAYQPTQDTVLKEVNKTNLKSAKAVFKNNQAYINAFAELDESLDEFYVEVVGDESSSIGKTTYYYAETGGTKWNKILSKLIPSSPQFNEFNGLYLMTYKILKSKYRNQSLTNYEQTLMQHNRVWDTLYRNFPGLILENVYSNESATTSNDLYILSKNAFKDMSYPENGYTLSLIDVDMLSGYHGQELHIGDGISINADEYDPDNQNIKHALSQYLFITDISYDLRKDSDVSLTVNSIKYQDKLIQRLVKLIK